MAVNAENLIWIDLEMTGLSPLEDRVIEIATVMTDKDLNWLADGPVLAVYQPETVLARMDDWNQQHHGDSGLLARVRASTLSAEDVATQTIEFLAQWVPAGKSPMCGNSICQDRRFLHCWMPALEAFFHYRNLDVSTLKELANRWAPELQKGFVKKSTHLALDDTKESIEELKYYRSTFIQLP